MNFILLLYYNLFLAIVNAKTISFEDREIQYFGRWQKRTDDIQSISSGAYFKATIKVNEQQHLIKLKLSQPAIIHIQTDKNGQFYKMEASYKGVYPIAVDVELPAPYPHDITLTIMSDIASTICLQAIEIDETSHSLTEDPDQQLPRLIEFVGHDLTLGLGTSNSLLTSFPWLVSTLLGTERSQIAFPGAWLMDHNDSIGMETQYFKGTSFYSPDVVVVLLGEYDQYPVVYTSRLSHFLLNIRSHFPQTIIFVLSEPLGVLFRDSQAAVDILNDGHNDQHVHFIDTTGWIRYGHGAYINSLHLNDLGQEKFAQKLAPLLHAKLSNLPFPGPQPNPNLPFNWQTTDVGQEGSVGLTGSVSFDSSKIFTLWGSGIGFSMEDGFRYVYQSLSGNGSIQVRVDSHSTFASCAKAGIMIREHLGHGSPHIMLGVSPQHGAFLQARQDNFDIAQVKKTRRLSPPYQLRLTRQTSSKFVAEITSITNELWEKLGVIETKIAQDVYIGMAVTSCDPKVVSVAKFADVTLSGGVGGGGFYYKQSGLIIQQQ